MSLSDTALCIPQQTGRSMKWEEGQIVRGKTALFNVGILCLHVSEKQEERRHPHQKSFTSIGWSSSVCVGENVG